MKVPEEIKTLYGLRKWVVKNNPKVIEITLDSGLNKIAEFGFQKWERYRGIPIKYTGERGFKELYYKGKPIVLSKVDNTVHVATFSHMYRTTSFDGKGPTYHGCLDMGYWCWKHAFEDPIKAIKFLLKSRRRD